MRRRPLLLLTALLCTSAGFGQPPPYHAPHEAVIGELEARALAVLDDRLGDGGYALQGGLVLAARDLCQAVHASEPDDGGELDGRMVKEALLGRGITETQAAPFAAGGSGAPAVLAAFSSHVDEDPDRYRHRVVGVGSRRLDDRTLLCAIAVRRAASLDEIERELPIPGQERVLGGELTAGFSAPVLVMATPGGHVLSVQPEMDGARFEARLRFDDAQGLYVVQLLADAGHGMEVFNQLPITVGDAGGVAEVVLSVPWREGPARNAWMVFDLINVHRREHGLDELEPDHELALAALSHCRDMEQAGFFGHVSPTAGDVEQRTAHIAGVDGAAEAIALARSPQRAFANLVSSPSHDAILRSERATAMGVAKVRTEEGMLFTVIVAERRDGSPAGVQLVQHPLQPGHPRERVVARGPGQRRDAAAKRRRLVHLHALDPTVDGRVELVVLHHGVDESQLERLPGLETRADQSHGEGPLASHARLDEGVHHQRVEAALHLGGEEPRPGSRHRQVAGGDQAHAAGHGRALDAGDDRQR